MTSVAFDLVLVGVIAVCAVSVVHSLAQAKLKQEQETRLAQLKVKAR